MQYPEMAGVLSDFFVWRIDPSAFPWHQQSAVWQSAMRMLATLVWSIEQIAPGERVAEALGGSSS